MLESEPPDTSKPLGPKPEVGWARAHICLRRAHPGGREDDDVLDVAPGEAGPHLQHQGYHASRQGCSG